MRIVIIRLIGIFALLASNLVSLSAFAATPATMADYWAGNAKWELAYKKDFGSNWPNWNFESSHITVVGTTWYIFSRTVTGNSSCTNNGGNQFGTAVQKSTDFGTTWTSPVAVLSPSASSAQTCAATDGSAFYDAANNKFRFLYQCLPAGGNWAGCYAEISGSDPTVGTVTYPYANPVIPARSLWNAICDSGDDCHSQSNGPNAIYDEGTFDIFKFDGTNYWFSFHGFDGKRGYRGIATTSTFAPYSFNTNGTGGTPTDDILDMNDAATWRENWVDGSIGFGASSTIEENGYYYSLAEAADNNLLCRDGQNWDLGLFRSSSLSSTNWQQYPLGNPIVYSSKLAESGSTSLPCNVQYGQFFRGGDSYIYMKYYRNTTAWNYRGTYFYRLVKSSNLLKNADLWMADTSYWNRAPSTTPNYAVYRYPNLSPDGTQVLASNCGTAACNVGQSIYQDVDVTGLGGRSFNFGGQFSTTSGSGTISLAVFQLDASYNILQSHSIPITASAGSYTNSASGTFTISSGAKYLRYQYYMSTPSITFLADNMFINLN